MILQALNECYGALAKRGEISLPGWCDAKVSYALDIDEQGTLHGLIPLKTSPDGKKEVPRILRVPEQTKKTSGVSANFLCENGSYFLCVDDKGKPQRTRQCFDAARALHEELLADVEGLSVHTAPSPEFDSNYWLCTLTLSPGLRIKGQANAYSSVVTGAVGGAAGVTHTGGKVRTDCQPNDNVEALRVYMLSKKIEARPVWKPMHKQPVYKNAPAYVNGVSESIFKVGMCLPAGPYVTDDDVRYIVASIKEAIVR